MINTQQQGATVNEELFKQQLAAGYGEQTCCNQAQAAGIGRTASMREQAETNVGYHRQEADRHDRAVAFFRDNPAFDQFLQLVRQGVIQLW